MLAVRVFSQHGRTRTDKCILGLGCKCYCDEFSCGFSAYISITEGVSVMDQRGHTGISKIIFGGWRLQFSGVVAIVAIASKNWKVEDFTQLKYICLTLIG